MPKALLVTVWLLMALPLAAAPVAPYESDASFKPASPLDEKMLAGLRQQKLPPAYLCSDEVFLRRVYIDLTGTLPQPLAAREFLQDQRPDKRAQLIDSLMATEEFASYWTMKWCDLLRVKAEFPINLWPNAVQAYHRYILESVRSNKPYHQMAREMLTSSGSNFRTPAVNFYRAVQGRSPEALAGAVALTFMGSRLDSWPADKRAQMAVFFSRVHYKKTGEWKEEIVTLDPTVQDPLEAVFPDGKKIKIAAGQDPRRVFADWLLAPGNPWFARAIANRSWSWFMGRGIIHEPDDIRPDNPPVNPELLATLQQEVVKADYDLRRVFRLILNSRTYQQSSIPQGDLALAEKHFAVYPVRRLEAEVLVDALGWFGGMSETYSSPIPEPFTYLPPEQRTVEIADGSITGQLLELFGRPPRDSGLEAERSNLPTDAQRLYLLNSADMQRKIMNSPRLQQIHQITGGNRRDTISWTYLTLLSRYPTTAEVERAEKHYQTPGLSQRQATEDLAWALINGKEFLYRH